MEDATLVQFFRDRFISDSSYQVQAEALRAIGRSGNRGQLDFLRQASEMDSPRDVIRAAAEWAIEEITKTRQVNSPT
jgi:aminopeptidase N